MNHTNQTTANALRAVRACPDRGAPLPVEYQRTDGAGELRQCRKLQRGVHLETCVSCRVDTLQIEQRTLRERSPDLIIRAMLQDNTGYGQMARQAGQALAARGVNVRYIAHTGVKNPADVHPFVSDRITPEYQHGTPILQIGPPHLRPIAGAQTLAWTMWESTGLSATALQALNRLHRVIVPTGWNHDTFRASGVTTPLSIVPLGYDPAEGYTARPWHDRPITFGMAGNTNSGALRKGFNEGVEAWRAAFEGRDDVRLILKVSAACPARLTIPSDDRVTVIASALDAGQVAAWYESIDVLFAPAKAEGWGLHTLQAMASGRPVITPFYSGTTAFWNPDLGWSLPFTVEPAGELWIGQGYWAVPTRDGMIDALRAAASDRAQIQAKGEAAAKAASAWQWSNIGPTLQRALPIGPITDPNLPPNREPGKPVEPSPLGVVNCGWWNGVG